MATSTNNASAFEVPDYSKQLAEIQTGSQFQAVTGSFDEAKGVAGRVNDITSSGSPLMTAARTRAKQTSAKMGLQNSSLAAQAGEQSVIETATPIATSDAQLYQNQQLANQNSQNQVGLANAQQRTTIGLQGLNLTENSRQFGQNLVEQRRQFDTTTGVNQQQFAQNLALEKENLAAQREQFAQKLGLDTAQLQLNRDQLTQQDRQFLADLDSKEKQLAQQESQFSRGEANKVTLANLDAQNRKDLMAIESQYKQDIESNKNISGAWATMMENINQINNNPDLDDSAKSTLIANQQAGFQSFTNFWKKANGGSVDVSDLLNFSQAAKPSQGGGGSQSKPPMGDDTNGDGIVDWRDGVSAGS